MQPLILKPLFTAFLKALKSYQQIMLFTHEFPDPDGLGTTAALKTWLEINFPDKIVIVSFDYQEQNPAVEAFLAKALKPHLQNKSINNPSSTLGIILDVHSLDRTMNADKLKTCEQIWIVDHHPQSKPLKTADNIFQFTEATAVATCELMGSFFYWAHHEHHYKMNGEIAMYLFWGIYFDSGGFLFSNTSPNTFGLIEFCAQQETFKLDQLTGLIRYKTLSHVLLEKSILSFLKISKKNIGYIFLSKQTIEKLKAPYPILKSLVYVLQDIQEFPIVVYASYDDQTQQYRVSIRSKTIPVNHIAQQFHGGGHALASGAKITSEAEFKNLLEKLEDLIISK